MKAFIGRLGVPSSRSVGGAAWRAMSSGLGLDEGVAPRVTSEALGELARWESSLCAVGALARTERRIFQSAFGLSWGGWSSARLTTAVSVQARLAMAGSWEKTPQEKGGLVLDSSVDRCVRKSRLLTYLRETFCQISCTTSEYTNQARYMYWYCTLHCVNGPRTHDDGDRYIMVSMPRTFPQIFSTSSCTSRLRAGRDTCNSRLKSCMIVCERRSCSRSCNRSIRHPLDLDLRHGPWRSWTAVRHCYRCCQCCCVWPSAIGPRARV